MKALVMERNVVRFAASRLLSELGSGRGARFAPLRLIDAEPPELPDGSWHRVAPVLSGICGSDLATIDGRSSRYFEPLVSFPFVPGHEVVGKLEADAPCATGGVLAAGTRVVVQPVLGCTVRGLEPRCEPCVRGATGNCEHTTLGAVAAGIQTGYCADTGGGWSAAGLVAHESQIYEVPAAMSDADAVTVEPLACAVHAALQAELAEGSLIAVLGAGTLGLALVAAISHLCARGLAGQPASLLVGARYPTQRALAKELGATSVLSEDQLARAVRRHSSSMARSIAISPSLCGGADVVFDCVGSAQSIQSALSIVRPRGTLVLVGMPGRLAVDLAPLWHREVRLLGAYAYGTETLPTGARPTFSLAMEVAAAKSTGRLVTTTYPLDRFEEALAHAGSAGRRGAVKIAFDVGASAGGRRR
ncbi:MAG: zinc-dependent alcohol dehydrogenase [Acidimicrobiales bacterium]